MLEVEVKYRCDDPGALEARLPAWQARLIETRADADLYFNAPHRDFAVTDEALRIRRIGARQVVTYKGPRIDAATKSRREIEVGLADGPEAAADFSQLLLALGFRPTAEVRKKRRVFEFQRDGFAVHLCLDDVAEVGRFAELEIVADEAQFAAARQTILACAAGLGLEQPERRSYLEMLLEKRGQ